MKGCRPLKNHEITALLETLGQREKVLVLTGLTFGLRIGEMLKLTFGHFEGEFFEMKHSSKNSNNATFPIPMHYREALKVLKKIYREKNFTVNRETRMFLNENGVAISRVGLHKHLKKACLQLNLTGTVNTHSFRKNFVTKIYELTGHDLAQTKVYSRHKSLSNLDYYIETSQETSLVNELTW